MERCVPLMKVPVSAEATIHAKGQSRYDDHVVFNDAVEYSAPKAIQILIQAGAHVNYSFPSKGTPLVCAVRLCKRDVVQLLL